MGLFVLVRPLSVKIEGTSEPLSAGRYCEVRCIVVGSRPLPRITWWKRGVQLTNTRETVSSSAEFGNIFVLLANLL